ncbi:MAG: ABC transporter ATP-binding protein [Candidatus Melainabacteria bacterium]|nr:ABC transporter ATP-binding protein [Candidatus Melainabacteria bacterium]
MPTPVTSSSLIVVENLFKQYQLTDPPVLKGVSFTVEKGTFVSLMGASGCGKSTLLHLLGALDTPTSGTVRINEVVISTFSEAQLALFRQQQLGFVFQFFNLLPTLSVLENVALPLLLNGYKREEAHHVAVDWLDKVGLSHRTNASPPQLSGGEQQRAAVVRALIHQPFLVLADEPTGNLDSASGAAVMSILKELAFAQGTTIVMATHSEELAQQTDRILRLKDGVLLQDDPLKAPSTVGLR